MLMRLAFLTFGQSKIQFFFRKLGANSEFSLHENPNFPSQAWVNTPRTEGGLGKMDIPVLSDFSKKISADFGILDKETGLSYRSEISIENYEKTLNFQRTFPDRPEWPSAPLLGQRSTSGPQCGRGAAHSEGIPIL